jgi:hypothetical protein
MYGYRDARFRLSDVLARLRSGEDATARLRDVPKLVEGVQKSRSAVPSTPLP